MITSELAVLYAYTIYLIGVENMHVELSAMRQAVAEFFFMAAMTSRYTFSGETRFEADLAALDSASGPEEFLTRLKRLSGLKLTEDFWSITLPESLATSGAKTPSRMAYQAGLVVLEARVLFSPMKIAAALDPRYQWAQSRSQKSIICFQRRISPVWDYSTQAGESDRKLRIAGVATQSKSWRQAASHVRATP